MITWAMDMLSYCVLRPNILILPHNSYRSTPKQETYTMDGSLATGVDLIKVDGTAGPLLGQVSQHFLDTLHVTGLRSNLKSKNQPLYVTSKAPCE